MRKLVLEQPGSAKIVVERKKEQPKDGGFPDETFTLLEPKQGPAKKWKASSVLYSITGLRVATNERRSSSMETSASSPLVAIDTSCPSASRLKRRPSAMCCSSSTTRMRLIPGFGIRDSGFGS